MLLWVENWQLISQIDTGEKYTSDVAEDVLNTSHWSIMTYKVLHIRADTLNF